MKAKFALAEAATWQMPHPQPQRYRGRTRSGSGSHPTALGSAPAVLLTTGRACSFSHSHPARPSRFAHPWWRRCIARDLHLSDHDSRGQSSYATRMWTPCPECAHALWSEVRRVGALRFVVYFDEDERSETYAEQVRSCPGCGAGLAIRGLLRHGRALRPRLRVWGDGGSR